MKRLIGLFIGFFLAFFVVAPTYAFNSKTAPVLNLPKEAQTQDVVKLPNRKNLQGGPDVQGYLLINRDKSVSKTSPKNNYKGKISQGTNSSVSQATGLDASGVNPCYSYTLGLRWKYSPEPWIFNTTNSRGLTGTTLLNKVQANTAKWEDAVDGVVGDGRSVDILGNGSLTNATLVLDYTGQNKVFFAKSDFPNAVSVVQTWGYFNGPPNGRKIIEWNEAFNDVDYDWSTNGAANKFDFENISTRELGLVFGLHDLEDPLCSNTAMSIYTSPGETDDRVLKSQDVKGVAELYEPTTTDSDQDGFTNLIERYIGTNPNATCGDGAWAPDIDNDGAVSILDMSVISNAFLARIGEAKYNVRYDLDADGAISILDMSLVLNYFIKRCTDLFPA